MTDPLAELMQRFVLHAGVFHTGRLCCHIRFDTEPALGYIHLLRNGRLRVETAGQPAQILDQATALFYPRPAIHRLVPLDEAGAELVCARLDTALSTTHPLTLCMPELIVLPLVHAPALGGILELLFQEALNEHDPGRDAVLSRLCEVVIVQLLRHLLHTGTTDASVLAGLAEPGLARVLDAIHREPGKAWSLEGLASLAGMSRSRFAAHFHTTIGRTPGDYLADWRLCVAQGLLRRGRSLKLVAGEVGYATPSALARLFRSRLKQSPLEWLRSAQG